jgi:gamma-glutamyltranspeptidase/glutathione hydrolase
VTYEPAAFDDAERDALVQGGYRLEATRSYGNMQIVEWLKKTGRVEAASDPRGEGSGLVK